MVSHLGSLEALRSNPRIVLVKRVIWLAVICVFFWAIGGFVNQFTNLVVSDKYAVTILVVGEHKLGLMHYDPKSQKVFKLVLPEKLELKIGGNQNVEADKLWGYAKSKGDPFVSVRESLTSFFGIALDGYVEDHTWDSGVFDINIAWVRSPKTRSSLKLWDRYSLVRSVGKLESSKVGVEELPSNLYQKKVQPDGYETFALDVGKFDLYAAGKFTIETLMADRRTVAIINGTGVAGQARVFERVLKTTGVGVVEISEANDDNKTCKVIFSGIADGIPQWLGDRFGCKMIEDKNTNRQAEIEVYLGKDWPLRLD